MKHAIKPTVPEELERITMRIFSEKSNEEFEQIALKIFRIQSRENPIYRDYIKYLGIKRETVNRLEDLPFLPVSCFKNHKVTLKGFRYQKPFQSSSTTGKGFSSHHIFSKKIYEESFIKGFEKGYGSASRYAFLCLLPSYLERENSSLVYMMRHLCAQSQYPQSGFFLYDHQELYEKLHTLEEQKIPTLLIGVSFAMLDFCQKFPIQLKSTIPMETGGMKGRQKEMIREELHQILKVAWGVDHIHSEYGMTELFSQAYAPQNGRFQTPHTMRVLPRSTEDPLSPAAMGETAGLNIIDLSNLYSCSFIATDDLGKVYSDGSFEVLGRFDFSEVRGCNLLSL